MEEISNLAILSSIARSKQNKFSRELPKIGLTGFRKTVYIENNILMAPRKDVKMTYLKADSIKSARLGESSVLSLIISKIFTERRKENRLPVH